MNIWEMIAGRRGSTRKTGTETHERVGPSFANEMGPDFGDEVRKTKNRVATRNEAIERGQAATKESEKKRESRERAQEEDAAREEILKNFLASAPQKIREAAAQGSNCISEVTYHHPMQEENIKHLPSYEKIKKFCEQNGFVLQSRHIRTYNGERNLYYPGKGFWVIEITF